MSMTDPIADMLTRIRNAVLAHHSSVQVPSSKLKKRIAQILTDEGYIVGFELESEGHRNNIRIGLKWDAGQAAIEGLKRVSTPGQRRYAGSTDIPTVRNGLGVMIISTSQGVMTDRAARKAGVGGELVCSIW